MRKLLFGLVGLAALGWGAAAPQPAEAQPYYRGWGYERPVVYYGRPAYRPVQYQYRYRYVRPRPYYGYRPYGYYRPAYVAPRCVYRARTVWNGWRWVQRPVRVCRW